MANSVTAMDRAMALRTRYPTYGNVQPNKQAATSGKTRPKSGAQKKA